MALVDTSTGEIVADLTSLEAVIERGLSSFVEVGEALMQIRDDRLYRADYDTFDDYCRERWGFGRAHSYRLIESAEVVAALSPIGDTRRPANEAQARALAPLKAAPEKMAEAMQRADEATGGKVTAEAIADAVSDLVASTEQKRQDAAELKELMDELQPSGFDASANAAAVEARGAFARLCRDIPKLGAPAEFVKAQRGELRERHLAYAEAAYSWLDEFLMTVREES